MFGKHNPLYDNLGTYILNIYCVSIIYIIMKLCLVNNPLYDNLGTYMYIEYLLCAYIIMKLC